VVPHQPNFSSFFAQHQHEQQERAGNLPFLYDSDIREYKDYTEEANRK